MKVKDREMCLNGASICRGIAIGKPFFFTIINDEVPEFTVPVKEIEEEIKRYSKAITRSKDDVKRLQKKLKKEKILEGADILDAHLQIMQDPLLTTHIQDKIRKTRKNAEFVFQSVIKQYQKKFQSIGDPFFRERFKDIQDISRRVMGYLRESVRVTLADIPSNSIVFSDELSASDAAEAKVSSVSAFVTTRGGSTSHAAIMAKAKGIPYVTDISFEKIAEIDEDTIVVVDGRTGNVIFHPNPETLKFYLEIKGNLESQISHLMKSNSLPPETIDGYQIQLSANIDMITELDSFHKQGNYGVGLFRSEFIFLSNDTFPTEEEQFQIYQRLVKKMKGLPIVIRTFDFGGDKLMLNPQFPFKGNPFLGSRAIRYLLKERDIFKAQLRAILRVTDLGDVKIMFPMISTLSELLEAKELLAEAYKELEKRDQHPSKPTRVGSMIEVPSAAIIADLIAKECDFLSIGTNDLVQYSLAVDRYNHSTHSMYAPTDPSVLRMIKLVTTEAHHQGIPVAICGEIAADPRFTPLLLGMGIHELSVAPRFLPAIKNAIRHTSIVEANHLAEKALKYTSAQDILHLLNKTYQRNHPEDQFYNVDSGDSEG